MNEQVIDRLVKHVFSDVVSIMELAVADGDAAEKAQGIRKGAAAILEKFEQSGAMGDVEIPDEVRELFITLIGEMVLGGIKAVA